MELRVRNVFLDLFRLPFAYSKLMGFLIMASTVLYALVPTFQIIFTAKFIDAALLIAKGEADISTALLPAGMVIFSVGFDWLNLKATDFAKIKMKLKIKETYRVEIAERCAKLDYKYIENADTQDLIKRVSEDADEKMFGCFVAMRNLVNVTVRVAGIVCVLFLQVWWAALIILAISVPFVIISIKGGRAQYKVNREVTKYERKYEYIADVMQKRDNVEERALFGYEEKMNGQYESFYKKAYKLWEKAFRKWQVRMRIGNLTTYLISMVLAGLLIGPAVQGTITIGMFLSIYKALLGLVTVLGYQTTKNMDDMAKRMEYLKDLGKFLKLDIDEDSVMPPGKKAAFVDEIRFENVGFTYPGTDKQILDGVNLTMKSGLNYAFVGTNGAGKTTITKLLTGLYKDYTGSIYINGKELKEYSHQDIVGFFSVSYQDFAKYQMTVKDNVYIGDISELDENRINDSLELAGLTETVNNLPDGIDTPLGKIESGGADISGGEWQRLAMARAIYNQAPFKILDEPTASLDPVSESRLYEHFEKISRGNTTLLISHRLGSCMLADKIFVISGGVVSEQGTHRQLMEQKGEYAVMYETQRSWYA